MNAAQPIPPFSLLLAAGFLLAAVCLSWALSLGLVRSLTVAAGRCYLQLLALGLALKWIFQTATPWIVLTLLIFMVAVATHTALARVRRAPPGLFFNGMGSLLFTSLAVTFTVTAVVIRVDPWYEPRYVIPLAGMVIGNAMNGMAVSLERFLEDLDAHRTRILTLLAFGASPWEASRDSARRALRAGLIPTINSMSAAGLVFIPGMMTGQVLSGTDPSTAASYQIVVLLMISAATTAASLLGILAAYRRSFGPDACFERQP